MQKQEYKNNIQSTNGIGEEIEFGVEVNEVIFQMLSSDVYNDPVLAVMREWSTNSCDVCIEAGLPVVYDVHIPTVSDPVFYVRDYGTGLSSEVVKTLFTKLGSSTKRNSSATNGCLGIGRMAGLSVAEAFTVESYYNGMAYSFIVSMRNGTPVAIPLAENVTNEPNGLKLSVSVNLEDISSYVDRVKNLYKYFDYKPNLNIEVDVNLDTGKKDWFVDDNLNGNYVLMSQVLYKIPETNEFNNHGFRSVVVKAPPGSVTFNPGRESLSLNKMTLEYLEGAFALVKKQFIGQALSEYSQKSSDKEIMDSYSNYSSTAPFILIDALSPYSYLSDYAKALCHFSKNSKQEVHRVIGTTKFYTLTSGKVGIAYKCKYVSTFKNIADNIVHYGSFYSDDTVLMDRKICSRKKLADVYDRKELNIWYKPSGVDLDIFLKEAKHVLSVLGIRYKLYSDIVPEEEKEQTIKTLREGFFASAVEGSSVCKSEYLPSEHVDNTDWLYLKLSGYTPQLSGTTSFETLSKIYYYLSRVTEMPNVKGVSKKYQKHVEGKSNWIDYETFIQEKLKEVTFVTDMKIPHKSITIRLPCITENFPETIKKAHIEITNYAKARKNDNFIWTDSAPDVKEFMDRLVPYKPEDPDFYTKLVDEYPLTTKVLTGEVKVYDGVAQHALEVALLEERCNAIHKTG